MVMSDVVRSRSPSPPQSLGSGGVHDSDGEIDAPGSPALEDDGPVFPVEGKYYSVQDREDVLAKPEIEREAILAERAEQALKRQQDQQLKRALAAAKSAASGRKRKAAADDDDGARRTRPKAEKTKTALDDYRRAREMKGADRGRSDVGRGARRDERSPSSAGSDRDADGESEVEWAEPSSDSRRREEPPPELKDFDRCRLGRTAFAKVCFFPGFQESVVGCFARVSIGPDRHTGQAMYRMAQIKGFTEGRPYQLEGPKGKPFTIDTYAIVAQGSAEKPWPFHACSDKPFTTNELGRFIETLEKENVRVPSKKYLAARLEALHNLLNTQFNDAMISAKLANQNAMERKFDPVNIAKAKKEKILKRRQQAEEDGNADEVIACDAELAALENSSQTSGHGANGLKHLSLNNPSRPMTHARDNQERLAALNQKNRGKNVEEVRKALLAEKRKLQAAREAALAEAQKKAAEEAAKREAEAQAKLLAIPGKGEMADLFGDSDVSRSGTPVPGGGVGTPKRSRAGTPMGGPGAKKEKGKGGPLGALARKRAEDEVIAGLEMDIDVEII